MFQDGIWLVYFNVVVCVRIQRRKKKKFKGKKKERERKKGKVPKRRKLKGFSSNFEKWNGRKEHCFEEVEVKKKCWMQIPKRVDIPTNLENISYIYLHPFFISIASRSSNQAGYSSQLPLNPQIELNIVFSCL